MSLKFASFDALPREKKTAALLHLRNQTQRRQDDYFLVLHALLDKDS